MVDQQAKECKVSWQPAEAGRECGKDSLRAFGTKQLVNTLTVTPELGKDYVAVAINRPVYECASQQP